MWKQSKRWPCRLQKFVLLCCELNIMGYYLFYLLSLEIYAEQRGKSNSQWLVKDYPEKSKQQMTCTKQKITLMHIYCNLHLVR